ncbi:MAG: hypothetical protein WBC04_05210 [Candidatus Acidiferrales bacterium]
MITSVQDAKDLLSGWKDQSAPVLVSFTTELSDLRFKGAVVQVNETGVWLSAGPWALWVGFERAKFEYAEPDSGCTLRVLLHTGDKCIVRELLRH